MKSFRVPAYPRKTILMEVLGWKQDYMPVGQNEENDSLNKDYYKAASYSGPAINLFYRVRLG
jgi:hypothetical protein